MQKITAEVTVSEIPLDMPAALKTFEKEIILAALRIKNNVKSKAAEILKINRTTLVEKMRRHEILEGTK